MSTPRGASAPDAMAHPSDAIDEAPAHKGCRGPCPSAEFYGLQIMRLLQDKAELELGVKMRDFLLKKAMSELEDLRDARIRAEEHANRERRTLFRVQSRVVDLATVSWALALCILVSMLLLIEVTKSASNFDRMYSASGVCMCAWWFGVFISVAYGLACCYISKCRGD
jgi:hypothetical protein